MKQNVYAVYDSTNDKLYQFAALETVLAKDAVMAFAEENFAELFGNESEEFKDFISLVSKSTSIEEMVEVLTQYDFMFNMIQI